MEMAAGALTLPSGRHARRVVIRGCILLLLACCGCSPADKPPNLLLLSIDTLRADHLGVYGYERETSPNLDAFAATSVRYAQAFAPAPWTLPSHVAIFSGRHPFDAGIEVLESGIPEGVPLVAETLTGVGYQCVAFVDSAPYGMLGGARGFRRGFELYRHAPHSQPKPHKYDMASSVDAALSWLGTRQSTSPFFLFLHTKSVHTTPLKPGKANRAQPPYEGREPFASRFRSGEPRRYEWTDGKARGGVSYLQAVNRKISSGRMSPRDFPAERLKELIVLYDSGIRYVDHHFERLLDGLERLELAGDTVILVTADHGEGFLDHAYFLHNETFTSTLHVPLFVRDPRQAEPRVVEELVSLMRIAPTLLSLAGLETPADMAPGALPGLDRIASSVTASGHTREEQLFSYYHMRPDHFYESYSLMQGPWRLVMHKTASWPDHRYALFNREIDPEERRPVDVPEVEQVLRRALEQRLEANRSVPEAPRIELDADTIDQLIGLGYLAGDARIAPSGDGSRVDQPAAPDGGRREGANGAPVPRRPGVKP